MSVRFAERLLGLLSSTLVSETIPHSLGASLLLSRWTPHRVEQSHPPLASKRHSAIRVAHAPHRRPSPKGRRTLRRHDSGALRAAPLATRTRRRLRLRLGVSPAWHCKAARTTSTSRALPLAPRRCRPGMPP
jgi:hypothetical protein